MSLPTIRPTTFGRVFARCLPGFAMVLAAIWPGVSRTARAEAASPLRLEDAVDLALSRNERSAISNLQVDVAEAGVQRARAAFLPIVTVAGTAQQHLEKVAPQSLGTTAVTINQPLLNASAWPLYAQARALADAQRAQNVDDKRLLAFSAASAFFAVLTASRVVEAAERQLDLAKANLADTKARAQAGLTSTNDVTRTQIEMAASEREVELDKGNLESAYVQLAFTINWPVSAPIAVPAPTLQAAEQPAGASDPLIAFALAHRPDIIASRHSLTAARDFAAEPLLRLVPTLSVQGSLTATTNPPPATGRWNDEILAATLGWTIYDGGTRYADKRSRDAQAAIADLSLRELERSVTAQVRSAAVLLGSAQAALHVADDAVTASRQSVDETAILYRQGLAKAIELVNANDARFSAEVNYATAQDAMAIAYLALRQALGLGPLGTELK
jgi:outer membrane protein TolC